MASPVGFTVGHHEATSGSCIVETLWWRRLNALLPFLHPRNTDTAAFVDTIVGLVGSVGEISGKGKEILDSVREMKPMSVTHATPLQVSDWQPP